MTIYNGRVIMISKFKIWSDSSAWERRSWSQMRQSAPPGLCLCTAQGRHLNPTTSLSYRDMTLTPLPCSSLPRSLTKRCSEHCSWRILGIHQWLSMWVYMSLRVYTWCTVYNLPKITKLFNLFFFINPFFSVWRWPNGAILCQACVWNSWQRCGYYCCTNVG